MNCTQCQNKIALHTEICPHCGTKQEHGEEFKTNEVFEAADEMNEILEIMQIAEYKKSRRKLFIRVTTSVLFLLAGLILSISGEDLLAFPTIFLPLACWASYGVTYMLGDGILSFFSKIWSIICAVVGFICASILYGIIMVVILGVVLAILSMFGDFALWFLVAAFIIALYAGVVVNLVAGIKDYNSYSMYKNTYLSAI